MNNKDFYYMQLALDEAYKGLYTTSPNPRVGCVIINEDNNIVGKGFHAKAGEPHAEVFALRDAGIHAKDSTVYVTLEPCSHYGKTPPCAEALIQAQVKRVVIAMTDPNPLVSGRGIQLLKNAGINVTVGILEDQARLLNQGFIKRMTEKMPYIRSKLAMSLDGKVALKNGISQWISSPLSRQDVHHWRATSCAIFTGSGTFLADKPQLNVRHVETSRQPLRIVFDRRNRINSTDHSDFIFVQNQIDNLTQQIQALTQQYQLNDVFLEAGSILNGAFLNENLIDEYLIYIAPVILGHQAKSLIDFDFTLSVMQDRFHLQYLETKSIGNDLFVRAKILK